MYILVTYDVDTTSKEGARRLRCVAKACLDYGQRVQNSVFECVVTEAQYSLLKGRVRDIIDMSLDSVSSSSSVFQSTHPHGVRPLIQSDAYINSTFQSTHPHGVRH